MKLVSVYRHKDAPAVLYDLLRERSQEPNINISHHGLPSWRKHLAFIRKRPFVGWYLIFIGDDCAGYVSLTKRDEVGIVLFRAFRGQGIGPKAVRELMKRHKRKTFLANINAKNAHSIAAFTKLGFGLLSHTYEFKGA